MQFCSRHIKVRIRLFYIQVYEKLPNDVHTSVYSFNSKQIAKKVDLNRAFIWELDMIHLN
jgi:hypothetical protein